MTATTPAPAATDQAGARPVGPRHLKSLIPHRFPILLVDRVDEVVPGERISTVKAVTVNEPWYRELPDDTDDAGYAYPLALLIESWCQSAALLSAWDQSPEEAAGQVALFGGMSGIEVLGQALPGDVLRHEVRISRAFEGTWIFEGATTVDGVEILRIDSVMTALRPSSALAPPAESTPAVSAPAESARAGSASAGAATGPAATAGGEAAV
ncbi:3-hydroxyacyl-ACP dehydratase FabZ family protein [Streptomyces zagrosensis]|uniref:3-hydroxyacyl-[acyl-carrier-protein] dehydratase n=1 Tax=Streptomyces zagrosensis TaxID=1042984 RepID=A0A7W9V2B9_9ACTN|nr:beta-hydroxyacyl-ACP dehydratase [Streptomyces zagrosensis]MBB5940158.1 3-hydroxyacyl-[acyl-carrier-protein] dehydratase [Streptomyces zagrosensis]